MQDVIEFVADVTGDSVEVRDRGLNGYTESYQVGPVAVMVNPKRPDMHVFVQIRGEGTEELGLERVAQIYFGLQLRASRVDWAIDGCPFTPAELRDNWQGGNIRTRCKVPQDAREGRQWPTCEWWESSSGDTFYMGSRKSMQYARCYDQRGPTRFELELKGEAADRAAWELFSEVYDAGAFAAGVMGWVRRFVDFVDEVSDTNVARRRLLPFWQAFVGGVDKVRVTLQGRCKRVLEDVQRWLERQVAPSLALIESVKGAGSIRKLLDRGHRRLEARGRRVIGAVSA